MEMNTEFASIDQHKIYHIIFVSQHVISHLYTCLPTQEPFYTEYNYF